MQPCWPDLPKRSSLDGGGGGGGGAVPAWSSWLTLADLDGGGVPDSDPGGIFGSISEPAPGVLQVVANPGGASHQGIGSGIAWISSAPSGWWGSQQWPIDGTGRLIIHARFVSTTSIAAEPWFVLNLGSDEGIGYGVGAGFMARVGLTTTAPFVVNGLIGVVSTTTLNHTDFVGDILPQSGSVATPGWVALHAAWSYGMYSDGTWASFTSNAARLPNLATSQVNTLSQSNLRLCLAVGNRIVSAVPFTLQASVRFAVVRTPKPPP